MQLSVAIATYNEEKKLGACLASVSSWTDEIVVVDGGSSDRTLEIAIKFKARIIETDNPPIFHINKQKALDACRGDWILQLDADEVVTSQLHDEILHTIHPNPYTLTPIPYEGFYIPRKNFFCGHWLRKGGQYPDTLIRLVRRGKSHFPCRSVHEQMAVDGSVWYLQNPLLHYPYDSIGEYWKKANTYIDLTSIEMKKRNVPKSPITWFMYNTVKPTVTFLLLYVRHKGFMDGYWGLLFALFSALHHPLAYMRYVKSAR